MIGWRSASCYTRQDVRNCESQYSFGSNPPPFSSSACRNYQDFRDCVVRIVRQSCYSQDLQLMATYLIDKAADLSWTCVINPDYSHPSRMDSNYNDPYRTGGSGYNPNYDNRGGSQYDRNRVYDSSRDGSYDRDRDRGYNRDQYGTGSQYDRDRFGGGSGGYYQGSQQGGSNYPYGSQDQGSIGKSSKVCQ